MAAITEEEWQALSEGFATADLLRAVDEIDRLRDHLNDGDGGQPPDIRTDVLKLHQKATAVINNGALGQAGDMFDLAMDLSDQVSQMMTYLAAVQGTLDRLAALYPHSLADDPE